jgi:signal transduction histidine kinase
MYLAIRFYNDSGDQIGQNTFKVFGDSAGWNGSLKKSPLAHRRETIVVPPQAARVWVVISSAGPPDAVGIYLIANLTVAQSSAQSSSKILIQFPFDRQSNDEITDPALLDWTRDGNTPSMAKITRFGQTPEQKAFAILDASVTSHAEWHTSKESAPAVTPGEQLVVEWNEMYSIGTGDIDQVTYHNLPLGTYRFHVVGLNDMGIPSGAEDTVTIIVPQIFWKTTWFRSGSLIIIFIVAGGSWRYMALQRMRREMLFLKNQQALERERLRIAHDIHDDLGARVTQISLLSAMSQDNLSFSENARANFEQISQMSRELVSALYQTVWAVNPENDNLDALGNYICQMVTQLCNRVQFRCRFHMVDLPRTIQVSSQIRHNVSMAVKEAVHNVIKHAQASEVTITIEFVKDLLAIIVCDNGCGFQPADSSPGNGLTNIKQRLNDIGGRCLIESQLGKGTTIRLSVTINLPDNNIKNDHQNKII